MSFPRYGSYKDSGVEWLREVPAHWDVMPLKRDLEFLTSGSRGWAEHYSDDGSLFLRIGNLRRDDVTLDLSDLQRVEVPDGAEGARTRTRPGDLLFSITAYLGSVAVVPEGLEEAYVSQHVALARLRRRRLLPRWVAYLTLSHVGQTQLATSGYGGTKIQLSLGDIADLGMTVPPLREQHAIADFLIRETAKIDALVAEQQRLIELLKEKRQMVISHAVTEGLNPDAPMRDSGIEWLGEVPAHWTVCRMKHVVSSHDGIQMGPFGGMLTNIESEATEFKLYGQENTISGDFERGSRWIEGARYRELARYALQAGDLVMTRKGSLGSCRIFPENACPGISDSDTIRLRVDEQAMLCQFALLLLQGAGYIDTQIAMTKRGAILSGLNTQVVADLVLAVPPVPEQATILNFIVDREMEAEALIRDACKAVGLLQERRNALISAAVTGQIDVRGLAQAEAA